MRRTLVTSVVPALAVMASWIALEEPRRSGEALLVTSAALVPALLPRWRLRLPALALGAVAAVGVAFRVAPWELAPLPGSPGAAGRLGEVAYTGVGDFYGVVLPFSPDRHPEMHALVLLAVFGFVAAVGLLIAGRQPYLAAGVTIAGIGWPATLLDSGAAAVGAVVLTAALWIFVVGRAQSVTAVAVGALASCAIVVGATWLSSATAFAREAALEWESWDFRGVPAKALGVRFVWNAGYDGIAFPPTKTTVLEIEGPVRPQYWRVATLDSFRAGRWYEERQLVSLGYARQDVPADALTPRAARKRSSWVEQDVTVKALVDDRVAATGTPVSFDGPPLESYFYYEGGVIQARHELGAGARYRIWSYVPDPTPAELEAAPARYPRAARRFLTVVETALPPFGAAARHERMQSLFDGPRVRTLNTAILGENRPLYELARRLVRGASTPYEAVRAIESYLRFTGGFRYDERPPRTSQGPPLVEFVRKTKAGYCQHFAGAMALMLRFVGIPARVAVGFTSGMLQGRTWKVTDHDAHAWVEAWFPRYGWLAFDPTPGRGTLTGRYSYASERAQTADALGRGDRAVPVPSRERTGGRPGRDGGVELPGSTAPSLFGVALVAATLWLLGVIVVKAGVRRGRRIARDPRRSATASRRELEAFLRDQGVEIPASATLAWLRQAAREELGVDLGRFAAAAARARFGPPADASRGARHARSELRRALQAARRELSPRARARGLVSLRSLRGSVRP